MFWDVWYSSTELLVPKGLVAFSGPKSSFGLDTLKFLFSHFLTIEMRINLQQNIYFFIFQGKVIYFSNIQTFIG